MRIQFKKVMLIMLLFMLQQKYAVSQVVKDSSVTKYAEAAKSYSSNDDGKIFTKVDVESDFPGGTAEWTKYLSNALSSFNPANKGAPRGIYKVIIKFIVAKDGTISDAEALTDFGYGMEKKSLQVINKSPKWKPAMQNGKPVRAYKKQPITFLVE